MFTTLALTLLSAGPQKPAEFHIVAASLFKNGFAVVSREFDAPVAGTYTIDTIPQTSMGTLWFSTSDGTKLDDVSTTMVEQKSNEPVSSIADVIAANQGHQVRIGIKFGDKAIGEVQEGKLIAVGGEYVILGTPTNSLLIPKSQITSISAVSGELLYKTEVKTYKRVLVIKTTGKAGHVHMTSLERGLTWSPAYAIDISDPKKLSIVAKATVLNDVEDLNGIEARFVTGFPNVPFATYLDPLIHGGTVRDFTAMLESMGNPSAVSPNRLSRGMGGQSVMAQNFAAPGPIDFGEAMSSSPLTAGSEEDLFFYRHPNITDKKGDRSYHILFNAQADYKDLYTWDIPDSTVNNTEYQGQPEASQDVWHSLQFKNTSGQPFTTAVATTFKDGQILGQDTMHYVTPGTSAEVRITKALDVHAEVDETEVSRERGVIKNPGNYPLFDLVSIKGTLRVTNLKAKKIAIRIKKELTGDVGAVSGVPAISKTTKGLRAMNPGNRIVWTPEIEAGKSLTLTYSFKLYVPTQR